MGPGGLFPNPPPPPSPAHLTARPDEPPTPAHRLSTAPSPPPPFPEASLSPGLSWGAHGVCVYAELLPLFSLFCVLSQNTE